MPEIYSVLANKMISMPARQPARMEKKPPDGDSFGMPEKWNEHLLALLTEATKNLEETTQALETVKAQAKVLEEKLEQVTTALKSSETRAAAVEAKYESMEKSGHSEMMKLVKTLSSGIVAVQNTMGKVASDVVEIRNKPLSVMPATPAKVPAPVVDMTAIISTIRAELGRQAPTQRINVESVVVERDANGYIKHFITKPAE